MLFKLDELKDGTSIPDNSGILVDRFLQAHDHKIEGLRQLMGKLPGEGDIYFIWTLKSFNAFTFIPYIIKHEGDIRELTIATYSISTRIVDALMKLLSRNRVQKVHLLISDSIQYRLPRVHDHLMALTRDHDQISVCYAWNHSKIALIRTMDNHYIVEGSGNFGENAQHEQYILVNSEKVYNFRKTDIDGIHGRTDKNN
jgi:hypothetical protein